jgi:hypothetical protein
MEYYFDINTQSHKDRLKRYDSSIVDDVTEELAKDAEEDVVDWYTVRKNGNRYIYLYDYKVTGLTDDENPDFLEKYRNAVAHQIWWLYMKRKWQTDLFKSRSKPKESVQFNEKMVNRRYPPGFEKHLKEYDTLPKL